MSIPRLFARISLFWKLLIATCAGVTLLFAVTGWLVLEHAVHLTSGTINAEVRTSLHAYESLWRARAERLSAISLVLSRMSDVRAAFGTRDPATIRDVAGEIWGPVSREGSLFMVTGPDGAVIASLGADIRDVAAVRAAAHRFPAQSSGFMMEGGRLYHIAITPVYVDASGGPALLNVLVAGYAVDEGVAGALRNATGGSDFIFLANGRVAASSTQTQTSGARSELSTPLLDVEGKPVGELRIRRGSDAARRQMATLRRNLVFVWAAAVAASLLLTWLLARLVLRPVRELDRAAAEIARGNYGSRVEVAGEDELARLARSFNAMSGAIQKAREELIRQERIATIGRLSTSLVHDLRNPLAAIYGGAEMLVDGDLAADQVKRLARNIYKSSRHVQELLQELVDASRSRAGSAEPCSLAAIVRDACELHASAAEAQRVAIVIAVPADLEARVERSRMERVFVNLVSNALEAMPRGGQLTITAVREPEAVVIRVEDTGNGVPAEIAPRLFQPFVTAGKKNGLGLGLAFARQTMLDHGGDLWLDSRPGEGARFCLRLPVLPTFHNPPTTPAGEAAHHGDVWRRQTPNGN
ncbi:MAG: ATP-binding protein [Bryobacteraceae bacterium]